MAAIVAVLQLILVQFSKFRISVLNVSEFEFNVYEVVALTLESPSFFSQSQNKLFECCNSAQMLSFQQEVFFFVSFFNFHKNKTWSKLFLLLTFEIKEI